MSIPVAKIAFNDMVEYIKKNNIQVTKPNGTSQCDVLYVTEKYLRNKETTRLNRALELNKLNMGKHSKGNEFRCNICGRFIGYKERIDIQYTPDTEYTYEEYTYTHIKCLKNEKN